MTNLKYLYLQVRGLEEEHTFTSYIIAQSKVLISKQADSIPHEEYLPFLENVHRIIESPVFNSGLSLTCPMNLKMKIVNIKGQYSYATVNMGLGMYYSCRIGHEKVLEVVSEIEHLLGFEVWIGERGA